MKALTDAGRSPLLAVRIPPNQMKQLAKLAGGKRKLPAYVRTIIQFWLVNAPIETRKGDAADLSSTTETTNA